MKHKLRNFTVLFIVLIVGIQLNVVFQISEVAASDNYTPQNSDYAMSVSVDLSNISIYEINNGNTTATNVSAKVGTTAFSGPVLLMFLPTAQVFSGSSPQAVLFTYNHLDNETSFMFSNSSPIITSFSSFGYKHIQSIYANLPSNLPSSKVYSVSSTNSLDTIEQFSIHMANLYSVENLKSLNSNFSSSDFNNQIGQQSTQKLKYTDANTLTGNVSAYNNLSSDTFQGGVDPNYVADVNQIDQLSASGPIPTSEFNPNYNKPQTQQTFFAGYNNFENDAIETPIKDYAINSLASQGIYLSADQIYVNYTSINDVSNNIQVSSALRDHILAPLNQKNSIFALRLLGFTLFTFSSPVQPVGASTNGFFSLPKVNLGLNGIVNGATKTISGGVNAVGGLAKTAASGGSALTSLAIDGTSSAVKGVFHNPITNGLGSAAGGVCSFGGKIVGGTVSAIGSAGNLVKKALNPASWLGGISSTIMSFLKPFLPLILMGIAILAVVLGAYMFGPKIIGGILAKKH